MTPEEPASRSPFKRQVGLVLLSGALTLVVAPIASFLIEQARWELQQNTFAERSRLEIVAEARRKFLGEFSEACWTLQLKMIDVPFNRQFSDEGFQKTCERYDAESPALFGRLRALTEGAVWFTSTEMQQKMDGHIAWLLAQDVTILQLRAGSQGPETWAQFHGRLFEETQTKTRALIRELATDYEVIAQ